MRVQSFPEDYLLSYSMNMLTLCQNGKARVYVQNSFCPFEAGIVLYPFAQLSKIPKACIFAAEAIMGDIFPGVVKEVYRSLFDLHSFKYGIHRTC